jgi:eukaryotic-like serine/threonine-protein kinase
MPLSPGDRLGPYEILGPLGQGGMGEVWKARDPRLNRIVAIKQSHVRFSERFEREAHAIAALNHPHICQIYDVGPDYLVMEYVEGQPLKGPVPLNEALTIAGQILDALDAAHRKGITHRDLKPDNILVGKAGVKILDFGLAKMDQPESGVSGDVIATKPLTAEGTILGTLHYMSPEQIEGQEADARSDIFAFGLVLYELITGQRAFEGKTRTSLVASILKDQPRPLSELQPLSPPALERVVATCLEKDPDKRWQSAREVKHALEWISAEAPKPTAPAPAPPPARRNWIWPAAVGALLVALGVSTWALWFKPAPPAHAMRFQVKLPDNVTVNEYVSVSPDGHKMVFNAAGDQSGLWIHDLDTLEWRRLVGTEDGRSPFWSPDSRFLGFAVGNQLKKIEVAGGPAQTLCSAPALIGTGTWNRDGVIVFGPYGVPGPLRRVSATGGIPADVTVPDRAHGEGAHSQPTFLPDGKHFLYYRRGPPDITGIYIGSLDAKPAEQSRERILENTFGLIYYAEGNLFFVREGTLMAQPFDQGRLKLRGDPVPVAEHVGTFANSAMFSVSATGVLAYRAGAAAAAGSQPTWFDRQGKVVGTFGEPSQDSAFVLSPDGSRAAVRGGAPGQPGDLWLLDFGRGVRTRFTFRQSAGSPAVWSPDDSHIIFAAGRSLNTIYKRIRAARARRRNCSRRRRKSRFRPVGPATAAFCSISPRSYRGQATICGCCLCRAIESQCCCWELSSTSAMAASRPTCAGLRTTPMSRGGLRSTSGHSTLPDLLVRLWAQANGKFPRTGEGSPSGAPTARSSFSARPMDHRWPWTRASANRRFSPESPSNFSLLPPTTGGTSPRTANAFSWPCLRTKRPPTSPSPWCSTGRPS